MYVCFIAILVEKNNEMYTFISNKERIKRFEIGSFFVINNVYCVWFEGVFCGKFSICFNNKVKLTIFYRNSNF